MRRAGILCHISSLQGGEIGTMGIHARAFVDFLQSAKQSIWQVLPINPPAGFASPYSAYSVFAGNPLLIDLTELETLGYLPKGSAPSGAPTSNTSVEFSRCERTSMSLLRLSFKNIPRGVEKDILAFRKEAKFWIEDYALFMSLKSKYGDIAYTDWAEPILFREESQLAEEKKELKEEINFWIFIQYIFFSQWGDLKKYANAKGISIMGDMPIYTSPDSADVWANSEVFLLENNAKSTLVAGVPPDAFTADGQRWGNPLYNWERLKESGYSWWIERMKHSAKLYDITRIDHFRALDEYYAIPAEDMNAKNGSWQKGPGMDFFDAINKELPQIELVAEDLGLLGDSVRELLADSGLPGMAVLLFAFDPKSNSSYLPHNHTKNLYGYIGTHDNDTACGWMRTADDEEACFAGDYLNLTEEEGYNWGMIRGLLSSVADTAIVQMQDYLGLGGKSRMNTPGTTSGNWLWRMPPNCLTQRLAEKIARLTNMYGR